VPNCGVMKGRGRGWLVCNDAANERCDTKSLQQRRFFSDSYGFEIYLMQQEDLMNDATSRTNLSECRAIVDICAAKSFFV